MFTGIVRAIGEVIRRRSCGEDLSLHIAGGRWGPPGLKEGDSVAVNGVCLTVVTAHEEAFEVDVSAETLRCTTLGGLREGEAVNLEPALTLSTPLGGHWVTGHVDGVGTLKARDQAGQSLHCHIAVPAHLAKYLAMKGSVCVDGVSLTVNRVIGDTFSVNLIPYTLKETTLGRRAVGDPLNVEVDLMARYLERLLTVSST